MSKEVAIVFVLFVVLVVGTCWFFDCSTPRPVAGQVVGRYVTSTFGRDHRTLRYVEVRDDAGDIRVFQVRNSVFDLDFCAPERFALLHEGDRVTLEVAGPRVPLVSYPRVRKVVP